MCDKEDEPLIEDDHAQLQFGTFNPPGYNRRMFGLSVGLSCILSFALMLALTTVNPYPAMGVSFVLGGLQGFLYPAMHQIWHYWAPPSERSILVTTAHSGAYFGMAIGLTTAEILAAFVHWTAPFIFIGTLGSLWMIVWLYHVRLKPELDKRISQLEREYIETATMHVANDTAAANDTPWMKIMVSLPVWAIVLENIARSWTMFLLAQHQLVFLKQTGLVSSIPHFLMGVNTAVGGRLAGRLIRWDKLSVANVRKLMNLIGFGTEGLCLLLMSFVMHNATISMLLLIVSVGMSGFAISGFQVNILDISGKHTGAIMAWSNGIGVTSGVICPLVTESLISSDGAGWPHVFQLAAGIHLSCLLFYIAFASGKLQHWAK